MELVKAFMRDEKKQYSQPPLILAVEDDDDNLLLLSYALELLGCRLICQKDGSTTVLVAKQYQPDLILLDILMPGISGIDVVRCLKQEPLTSNITAIAITALATADDRERILMSGFTDYISKPYMIEDLEAMVSHYLYKKPNPQSACKVCQE